MRPKGAPKSRSAASWWMVGVGAPKKEAPTRVDRLVNIGPRGRPEKGEKRKAGDMCVLVLYKKAGGREGTQARILFPALSETHKKE